MGLTTSGYKNGLGMKCNKGSMAATVSLDEQPKPRKMDMRFGMWNFKSLYRTSFLMRYAKELIKYRLDIVGLQEVS
jgi:hypothetical protein